MNSSQDVAKLLDAKKFFEDFLENTPPYKPIKLKFPYELTRLNELAVQLFCDKCEDERTFTLKRNTATEISLFPKLSYQFIEDTPFLPTSGVQTDSRNNVKQISFLAHCESFAFSCAKCGAKAFFCVMIDGLKIKKLGQHPAFTDLKAREFIKYKNLNIINKHYPELKKSVKSISQEMGIGAFAYLRRIYESLIDKKYKELPNEKKQNAESVGGKIKFVDKLKAVESVEKVIPPQLDKIKNELYSILSKGLHEYEEAECQNLFESVLFSIEFILKKELQKRDDDKQAEKAIAKVKKKLENNASGG